MNETLNPDWPVFALSENDDKFSLLYEMFPSIDTLGREYEMVTQCLEDDDFYQGLNMITVIRRKSDRKLFGYSWWNDNSKHGEGDAEPNGDSFGIECDTSAEDFNWDEDYISYWVFKPVHPSTLIIYSYLGDKDD